MSVPRGLYRALTGAAIGGCIFFSSVPVAAAGGDPPQIGSELSARLQITRSIYSASEVLGASRLTGCTSGTPLCPYDEPQSASSPQSTDAPVAPVAHSGSVSLNGSGSSFAGPEISQWASDVAKPPYNLGINYNSSASSDGRFEFANQTVDYAVTDIEYQPYPFDTKSPAFPFIYIPVTAGGLAFMYHLNGLGHNLQLSSYSACAIFTGAVTNWSDPVIAADNPGLSLPNLPIHPVTRTDLAGSNFVFQEYCIEEQPNLWKAFVTSPSVTGYPGQVGDLSPDQTRSDWPIFQNAIPVSGSANSADTVANAVDNGYITAVETAYAIQRNMPVANVKNASGFYTAPSALDVDSALAYASQQSNGTHVLNFNGAGAHVYNPSTYSYIVVPSAGWDTSKGSVMSQFLDYSLTIGQTKADEIGYAGLGLSLEQYGVDAAKNNIPSFVAPTADEEKAYACGDLTPAEVQAGQTTPTCGVVNGTNGVAGGLTPGNAGASGAGFVGPGGGGEGVDPRVSLVLPGVNTPGATPMAFTGADSIMIAAAGLLLIGVGTSGLRMARRRPAHAVPPPGDAS